MSRSRKIVIGVVVAVAVGAAATFAWLRARERAPEVRMESVQRRDLVATVTASGNVRARRSVDISSDVMGRVTELNVDEGDDVERGQVLLRLDPSQIRAAVARSRAALSQAEAQVAREEAGLLRARRDFDRVRTLWTRDSTLVSRQQLDDARTTLQVSEAQLTAARHGVDQARAALAEAEDQLSKTVIRAPIAGRVTRLNIEEGETAVVGTMNNPGSLLLTISDLSVVEAVLEVDETDVPEVALGDSAVVEIDAFPARVFRGTVTKIGQSAIRPPESQPAGGQTTAIDFEVVVTLNEPPEVLRPDLSATADIITAVREDVLTIPIIALTVREGEREPDEPEEEEEDPGAPARATEEGPLRRVLAEREVEGVYRVRDRTARFTPVEVGIAGQEYFEVTSGLEEGDTVVAGPYQAIRRLADGDRVRPWDEDDERGR